MSVGPVAINEPAMPYVPMKVTDTTKSATATTSVTQINQDEKSKTEASTAQKLPSSSQKLGFGNKFKSCFLHKIPLRHVLMVDYPPFRTQKCSAHSRDGFLSRFVTLPGSWHLCTAENRACFDYSR